MADGDIGLRSKSYLADFWNRLSPAERWKIIGSSMAVSDTTSPLKSSKRERRGHVKSVSGAASVTSLASGPSGITSSNGSGSGPVAYGKPSRDDDQATVGSDGHTALLPSSALSVGAASAGNKSFSVFERQRRRA